MTAGCGAPDQDQDVAVGSKETVIEGQVLSGGQPVSSAYVRLLNDSGEFTAEVPTGGTGNFRFFAAPGSWTVRALSSSGTGEQTLTAAAGRNAVTLELA
jgi:hypothetical protein